MFKKRPSETVLQLIRDAGDKNRVVAFRAQQELAVALQGPLREAILSGDIFSNIFTPIPLGAGGTVEYPLDLLAPGDEDEHVAYTSPGNGRIAERQVEGDRIMIPTFMIESAIDLLKKYAREANWDVLGRAMQVLQASFVKKMNDDAWHVVLSGAADRNILVYDADASAGQFTKRLVSLAKIVMRRNGGGNSNSLNRRSLTHIAFSPEGLEDIRNWGLDQVDEVTRREIYVAGDKADSVSRVFGVNLLDLDEFGVGQQYNSFWTNNLGAQIQGSDTELAIGLDLSRGTFIMPIRQEVEISADPWLDRSHKLGWYGSADQGFALVESRDVISLSF